jgi:uncharacterized membrane protein YeaQ/YmgE (transglycosylase-associated protein family)
MSIVLALAVGLLIGWAACLPRPHKPPRGVAISMSIGAAGGLVGWFLDRVLGVAQVGWAAELFFWVLTAAAAVSMYQIATSEQPPLR